MTIEQILLDHGSGGKLSNDLIKSLMLPAFQNNTLSELNDGADIDIAGSRIAFSTDTYVVDPIFFPGGNIGDLAVNGTINDVSMCGGTPLFLSVGMILEEGFLIADLRTILDSMRAASRQANVKIVTGDTKVVPKGAADKIYINTSGIGRIPDDVKISGHRARPGDKILLSGTMADHGITILIQRESMNFESALISDTAPLNKMVDRMLSVCRDIHVLRDPTRGGVGTTLNEIAEQANVNIKIYEEAIPIKNEVAGICELLGFDPLYVANEGKLLAFVSSEHADAVLSAMKNDPNGQDACMIGEVLDDQNAQVVMQTRIGGTRMINMMVGEQLPRIC